VRSASEQWHIRLVPYICYTPRWASKSAQNFWSQPPTNTAAFADFVRALVGRYKDRIHSWEIWNEPDNREYWLGSFEEFAGLLNAGSRAAHEADPEAQIVMGGLAWNLGFLAAILTNKAAIQNINVFNLHNYYETWSNESLEKIPEYVGRAAEILAAHRNDSRLWMAEVGYSSFRRGNFVSAQTEADYPYEHTDSYQATSLFRALTLVLASGKVSLVTWYRIHDLPEAQEIIGDENNRHLGVLDEAGHEKPALKALRYFETLFGQGALGCDDKVSVEKPVGSRAEVHSFLLPDDRIVFAAWLRTAVPGQRGRTLNPKEIPRSERIAIVSPFELNGNTQVFNELGGVEARNAHERTKERRLELELTDSHVKVAILKRKS